MCEPSRPLGTRARIEIRYKTSRGKAYLKDGRALRVDTTINNPEHFALQKTLNSENWRALRQVGARVNTRFLEALGEGAQGLPTLRPCRASCCPLSTTASGPPDCASATPGPWPCSPPSPPSSTSPPASRSGPCASTWPTSTTPPTPPARPPTTCVAFA